MPDFPVRHQLPKLAQTYVHWVGDAINHLILCHSLLLLPSIFPSIRVFSNESVFSNEFFASGGQSIGVSALTSVHPMNIQDGFPFRIDWFDLLAVQGTLKSLLQPRNLKASILCHSSFFMVQYPYVTTGKTIALTVWTFIVKEMSLLFNTLARFVIAFLPRSKCILISWLQSTSTLILEPKKIKHVAASTFLLPFAMKCWMVMDREAWHICSPWGCKELDMTEQLTWTELMELDPVILVFWMLSFKPVFSLFSFTLFQRLFSSSSLLPFILYHLCIWDCWYFSWISWF